MSALAAHSPRSAPIDVPYTASVRSVYCGAAPPVLLHGRGDVAVLLTSEGRTAPRTYRHGPHRGDTFSHFESRLDAVFACPGREDTMRAAIAKGAKVHVFHRANRSDAVADDAVSSLLPFQYYGAADSAMELPTTGRDPRFRLAKVVAFPAQCDRRTDGSWAKGALRCIRADTDAMDAAGEDYSGVVYVLR